ncbi:MAG: (Fe-S)-binding protein, partial [Alphaproteobacteria bacterium]
LGAETPTDFTWNRLLSFDACIQCGRCQRACPAFGAGLPLNPKKLMQNIHAASAVTGDDRAYRGAPHPGRVSGDGRGGRDQPLVGADAMIHLDTLWACTTCLACVHSCPMMIEHVDAVIDLRRFETLERGPPRSRPPLCSTSCAPPTIPADGPWPAASIGPAIWNCR